MELEWEGNLSEVSQCGKSQIVVISLFNCSALCFHQDLLPDLVKLQFAVDFMFESSPISALSPKFRQVAIFASQVAVPIDEQTWLSPISILHGTARRRTGSEE
jgi:hypothetical protein